MQLLLIVIAHVRCRITSGAQNKTALNFCSVYTAYTFSYRRTVNTSDFIVGFSCDGETAPVILAFPIVTMTKPIIRYTHPLKRVLYECTILSHHFTVYRDCAQFNTMTLECQNSFFTGVVLAFQRHRRSSLYRVHYWPPPFQPRPPVSAARAWSSHNASRGTSSSASTRSTITTSLRSRRWRTTRGTTSCSSWTTWTKRARWSWCICSRIARPLTDRFDTSDCTERSTAQCSVCATCATRTRCSCALATRAVLRSWRSRAPKTSSRTRGARRTATGTTKPTWFALWATREFWSARGTRGVWICSESKAARALCCSSASKPISTGLSPRRAAATRSWRWLPPTRFCASTGCAATGSRSSRASNSARIRFVLLSSCGSRIGCLSLSTTWTRLRTSLLSSHWAALDLSAAASSSLPATVSKRRVCVHWTTGSQFSTRRWANCCSTRSINTRPPTVRPMASKQVY